MVKNNNAVFIVVIIGAILILPNLSLTSETQSSIRDRDSIEECNDERQERIDRGDPCVGDCQRIFQQHVPCANIAQSEVGNFGFFFDRSVPCEELSGEDLEKWECFYGFDPRQTTTTTTFTVATTTSTQAGATTSTTLPVSTDVCPDGFLNGLGKALTPEDCKKGASYIIIGGLIFGALIIFSLFRKK